MIVRATDCMSARWWVALAVALSFILVARTGTVGAPAEAHHAERVSSLGDRRAAYRAGQLPAGGEELSISAALRARALLSLEGNVRQLEGQVRQRDAEIIALQDALMLERTRAQVLEASYEDLEGQFDDISQSVRGFVEASARRGTNNNQPIDATAVRVDDPETARTTRTER